MTITLNDFRAALQDVARPNRFLANITGPVASSVASNIFPFYVAKAQLPKIDITGPMIKFRGTQLQMAGDYKHDPFMVTFLNDRGWLARSFFEGWINGITESGEENTRASNDVFRFGNSLIIDQIGRNEFDILATYEYFECIPLEISEIELDQAMNDTIEEFQVTFHYSHWKRINDIDLTLDF